MNENGIFTVVRSLSNAVNTIDELDEQIIQEVRELRAIELMNRREQLFEVLKGLVWDFENETCQRIFKFSKPV